MMQKATTIFLIFITVLTGCNKTEEKIIPGNTPPPDPTQPASLRGNFIIKSYIGLLGRESSDEEYNEAKTALDNNNFDKNSRKTVVSSILEKNDFYSREFEIARINLLNGLDTLQIRDFINTFEYLLTLPSFEEQWPLIQTELDRIYPLQNSVQDLISGNASISAVHKRCLYNNFYDEINMGSLNFVIACFQNLLLRNPTAYESEQGVLMVDGFNALLFLESGQSKSDFLDIFIESDDYYEGQVQLLFNRFLFRAPNSEEMTTYSELYKNSGNYKSLISEILSTDEYAGLK
ncbi:MAG: hypothetical protein WED33_06160 [Bacteroidia bacterium]